jgi:hypothetical protein
MLDAPQAPEELAGFFDAQLTQLGWSPPPNAIATRGSNPFPGMEVAEYCQSPAGPYLRLSLYARTDGGSHVQVHAEIGEPDRCLSQTRSSRPLSSELIPTLSGPNRELVSFSGRGQGRTETAVEATVATEATVDRLDVHIAQQLTASGWSRLASGGSDSLVWGLWSLPDYGDWEALVVFFPGSAAGQQTLFVRLKSWQDA